MNVIREWIDANGLGEDLNRVGFEPNPIREREDAILSPTPEEMADAVSDPDAKLRIYTVTYQRVGRRGGRDDRFGPPPPPLVCQAMTGEALADRIYDDVFRYLLSTDVDVWVDLERMAGGIFCGFNNGGSFTITAEDLTPTTAGRAA